MLSYNTIDFKNKIKSDYLGEDIMDLLSQTFIIPSNYSYDVFKVTEEYIARPDLISLDAYGDDMFADVICKLNGISNPFELNKDMLLIIPSPENITDFANSAAAMDYKWNESKPIQQVKTKQTKRQANEAIIGDTRFKINQSSGIVIY